MLVLIYVLVTTAAQAYGGLGNLVNNPSDVFAPLGHGVLRQRPRQDPDARDPELGVGLDADDDPADRAHDALDGPRRRDPQAVR